MIDIVALLSNLPHPLDHLTSLLLLEHLPNADAYLLVTALLLLSLAFFQLHAFSRPPPVPLKRLPKRPTLHVLFKPDDIGQPHRRERGAAISRGAQQMASSGGGAAVGRVSAGAGDDSYDGRSLDNRHGGDSAGGSASESVTNANNAAGERSSGRSANPADDATATTTSSTTLPSSSQNTKGTPTHHALHDLPDSFAPLLSSSLMEIINQNLTADLLHAVQFDGSVRMRSGRHEVPLSRSSVKAGRPQLVLDVGKDGCKMTVRAAVGSDNLTTAEDLDVNRSTRTRSRPMVKYANLVLDPPLPLANVAPTLIHFPTLFEDNLVPSLRRIQLVRYAFDLLVAFSSLLEKLLWIVESKCQIHLSKIKISPFYKGDWRLSLSFSGHLLLFGWIPVPFIGVVLPTLVIPQPHALLERLLTAQPLASAKLRKDNLVEEERIALAVLRAAESWQGTVKAVATPPAVGIDLTVPGGLTVAVEMMHGRDLFAGVRRNEGDVGGSPIGAAIGRTLSADSLSSWASPSLGGEHRSSHHPATSAKRRSTAFMPPLGHRNASMSTVPPPEPFDVNDLVPWLLELGMKGRIDDDKVSLTVTKLALSHESQSAREGLATSSKMSVTGSVIISKADPAIAAAGAGPVASHISNLAQARKMPSSTHLAALTATASSPSVCEVLLYPNTSPGASLSQRLNQFLAYDYAFDISDDTQLDAISLSIGATHPLLKGGTLITTVVETIYAYGSLSAREGAVMDLTERRRKRNILRHLPAVDFTAGINNIFIPEESMSYSDDGQTRCIPELKGGRMMIRAVGGFDRDPSQLSRGGMEDTSFEEDADLYVRDGVKFCVDFAASSFSMDNQTNIHEFPELDILERSLMNVLLSGTFGGRIATHLRPQNIQIDASTGMAPNLLNPLEAYEIDFTGSNASLKLKEGSVMLGHRRVICPTETIVELKIVESVVDMSFEGQTECEVSWDFNGSSPILQTVEVGKSPIDTSHEQRKQVELLIYELRQGRLNLLVSPVGGLSIQKAATSREDREGLYDWRFFNALVAPDEDSVTRILDVIHDKRSMKRLLAVLNLINNDLERLARYILTRAWKAKDIFTKEGVDAPSKLIPGHRMARLASLYLCGDVSQVDDILPIIQRVVAGNGLDVVRVKDLLRKNMETYDDWAPEIDRVVRWIDTAVSPMDAQKPYIEHHCPPLSELPSYQAHFGGIPSAREIYDRLMEKQQLPLDAKVSSMIASCAPYMTLPQIEFVLTARRRPSDWMPEDLRRIRYVYSIKKKVQDISESYGGLSFLPQSFFVSIFLGEATRASLRASRRQSNGGAATESAEAPWPANESPGRRASTLTRLRRRRVYAPQPSYLPSDSERGQYGSADHLADEEFLSPAGRVASQNNIARRVRKNYRASADGPSEASDAGEGGSAYDLGDSLLGPQDVAILLQAGLTSSMKGSTVVQLNQRMLLDLMASQPRSFAVAVLAEIGTPGGQGSPRGLCSALMALLELDQSSFTKFHRIDMHSLLESWLPGLKIPVREDYLAGGRWARQSYYDALFSVASSILEDAEIYSAVKWHIQRVRHHVETDPIPLAKELNAHADSVGIDIDSSNPDLQARPVDKLTQAIDYAKERIAAADNQGKLAVADIKQSPNSSVADLESCQAATELYRAAFDACAEVLKLDKLAFQADWFKAFFRRNYDALMIKSVYDNIVDDVDNVREWMDALRRGDIVLKRASEAQNNLSGGLFGMSGESTEGGGHHTPPPPGSPFPNVVKAAENILRSPFQGPPGPLEQAKAVEDTFFANPSDRSEQEIIDGIIDALFFVEEEREVLRSDPLNRLLIPNPPGNYDFTIVCAFGVITEGEKGAELAAALHRLEKERGVKAIRSDTGTARSFEYNANKIEDAIEKANKLGRPYGLLGYSQGCANALMAESLLLSGSPRQQKLLVSHGKGLVCRQMLFSAANGSMHGPASDVKVQRLITMAEAGFKYQQGYCSRAFISSVLETLNAAMDSAGFQKFIGGAETFLPDGNRAFWREAQHLPHVPTTVLRGVLEEHTTPESLDMVSNLLTKQSGSAHHDSQVHVYDAVGHPIYTINRNGRILEKSDMGGSVQRTHHWSPLNEEVSYVETKRDIERAAFECAKDRHIFPWVDVNARFGVIPYVDEWVALSRRQSKSKEDADADTNTIEEKEEEEDDVVEAVTEKM